MDPKEFQPKGFWSTAPKAPVSKETQDLLKVRFTMVENGKKHRQNSNLINQFPTSEGVSEVSERANEWAVRANERMDERVAQYYSLYSWLFSTIVLLQILLLLPPNPSSFLMCSVSQFWEGKSFLFIHIWNRKINVQLMRWQIEIDGTRKHNKIERGHWCEK